MIMTVPILMIMYIQVFKQITHIPRKDQENGLLIFNIGKKEINIICSLLLEEMVRIFNQE
jgi:hypothetical protein